MTSIHIKKLSIIIPVYNEEITIQQVVLDHIACIDEIKSQFQDWEIICLDDASTDKTASILSSLSARYPQVRIVTHSKNQGINSSFQELALAASGDWIYHTASDGQWPASNLKRLLLKAEKESLDFVIGVRPNRKQVYSWWRLILSHGFNWLPQFFFGVETKDVNGIKFGRKEIFRISLRSKSFFGEIERVLEAVKQGYRIGHETIEFLPRGHGKASGAKWKYIIRTAYDFLSYLVLNLVKR